MYKHATENNNTTKKKTITSPNQAVTWDNCQSYKYNRNDRHLFTFFVAFDAGFAVLDLGFAAEVAYSAQILVSWLTLGNFPKLTFFVVVAPFVVAFFACALSFFMPAAFALAAGVVPVTA